MPYIIFWGSPLTFRDLLLDHILLWSCPGWEATHWSGLTHSLPAQSLQMLGLFPKYLDGRDASSHGKGSNCCLSLYTPWQFRELSLNQTPQFCWGTHVGNSSVTYRWLRWTPSQIWVEADPVSADSDGLLAASTSGRFYSSIIILHSLLLRPGLCSWSDLTSQNCMLVC